MIRNFWLKLIAPIDGPLLGFSALLLLVALIAVGSASPERVTAQLLNIAVALTVMRIVAQMPPQRLMHLALPAYAFGILLLIAVALFGDVSKGARRWLNLGFMRIQPSEVMKIAMPLMLAWYFQKHEAMLRLRDYAVAVLLLLLPVALIARQPDLGTAVLVSAAGFFVIFLAGLPWKVIIGLGAAGAAAAPFAWNLLHDYQRSRVLTLFDPERDPLGKGFHIIQSTIAIGSGGILGKGWGQGTQAQLEFIPERHTDFIFAVYSEEFGLLGNLVLLFLYALLIGRGLMIAANAATLFSRLLAGAITLIFFTYAFVNMGMVSGILPVVGVPLPLISYGGTALVTLFLGIGILMSIHKNRMLVQK
ncbi:rod shape-determining protein RodA [Sulfurisoma sediminicola]|uniref:Peptidoglycan glycosyltransferase MrdB n=1 Tax=Sulfurisoma sediminicola TaxID=1381557 RepID=A0A497XK02_9PROT|nr:rod shape-determining protein RodA [Sulfurisoma sediminicola]RLJ68282.1 cell elongation-specific peptidoglycan biosynthesis regulator RodA [Sulfurisoma sediminicola]